MAGLSHPRGRPAGAGARRRAQPPEAACDIRTQPRHRGAAAPARHGTRPAWPARHGRRSRPRFAFAANTPDYPRRARSPWRSRNGSHEPSTHERKRTEPRTGDVAAPPTSRRPRDRDAGDRRARAGLRAAAADRTGAALLCQLPPGDLGRCTTTFSSPSGYTADFEIRNLPAGSYSFSWTSDLGVALTCTTHRCRQHYRGDMPVADVINVTYTDLVTGEARTLTRFVRFNGRI